ncbi:MAG: sulfurtransferase, partial [Pseudomonadales bacterium]|nr:sulfurtransferase [Pseudomonadales bacterium]
SSLFTSREATTLRPICYCGSGVTACHNIFAMVYAGYPMPRLYPGSWSEWITDSERPVER